MPLFKDILISFCPIFYFYRTAIIIFKSNFYIFDLMAGSFGEGCLRVAIGNIQESVYKKSD